jgi:Zn-dependent M28 family amino/carboxypeptidase
MTENPLNPFLAIDRQMVGDIYTSTEVMDVLTVLCDEFGSRFGGTAGERQAAEFMKARLESYGLSNVHLEPFEYIGWERGDCRLEITSPVQVTIPCITLPHSPPADLIGEVIDLGDGSPDDFERLAAEIEGKLVLTNSDPHPPGVTRWIHRNEKYGRSLLAGAVGFIFVNHYPGYGPATGGIGPDEGGGALIPGVSVSREDGAYFQRLMHNGPVTVRLTSSDRIAPMTSWNVIGDIPGRRWPEQIVMLGSHYDGHDISQGAEDPASGTAAVMEVARVLARHAQGQLGATIRVALWGVEEIGLIGSTAYARQHADELDNIRFYLNMDSAGAIHPKDIILNQWPDLEAPIRVWSRETALPFEIGQSLSAHSDHYPFMIAGVPTGSIGSLRSKKSGRGYGHTRYDTLDKVELRGLREAADLAARLVLRIAAAEEWPVQRRDPEAVKKALDRPDFQEEAELFARVTAFYERVASGR